MKMLPVLVQSSVTQLLICWIQLHRSETRMYRALDKIAHQDATASLFMTVPGVGAATAVESLVLLRRIRASPIRKRLQVTLDLLQKCIN
jgi:hypothetical protein